MIISCACMYISVISTDYFYYPNTHEDFCWSKPLAWLSRRTLKTGTHGQHSARQLTYLLTLASFSGVICSTERHALDSSDFHRPPREQSSHQGTRQCDYISLSQITPSTSVDYYFRQIPLARVSWHPSRAACTVNGLLARP